MADKVISVFAAYILAKAVSQGELNVTKDQWRSQTFPDGGAQSLYRILSMITHRHAGSYVHLLKVVVCMEKA